MAFNNKKLAPMSNNARSGDIPMVWLYDNVVEDTVTGAGFIPTGYGLRARDTVQVTDADGDIAWYKVGITDNVATLTLMTAVSSFSFTDLDDTPASLTANKGFAVNAGGTAIEEVDLVAELSDLSDVTITTPSDDQELKYATDKFVNYTPA